MANDSKPQDQSPQAVKQQLDAARAETTKALNKANAAEKKAAAATKKLSTLGKRLDAAKKKVAELESLEKALRQQIKIAEGRTSFKPGEGYEVVTIRDTPFLGQVLPINTVIGTVVPKEGESPEYVLSAVSTNYAKCVRSAGADEDEGDAEGGDGS